MELLNFDSRSVIILKNNTFSIFFVSFEFLTMTFHLANTWKERGLQMQAVKDKCNRIIKRLSLPEKDARVQGLIHVRQLCNTIAAVAIKLLQNAEIKTNIPIIMKLLGMRDIKSLQSCFNDLNPNSKTSFVTMCQFALENCIHRVLDAIPGEHSQGTFKKSAQKIIEITDISESEKKLDIILVPTWIRNTLHAGGIHARDNKTIIIDNEPYIFEKDKRFSCASWSQIMHSFLNALDVYEEIICSKKVNSIRFIKSIN